MALTPQEIVPIFRAFHNRDPSPEAIAAWQSRARDVEALVRGLREVMEAVRRASEQASGKPSARQALAGALMALDAEPNASSSFLKRAGPSSGRRCRRKRASSSAGETGAVASIDMDHP